MREGRGEKDEGGRGRELGLGFGRGEGLFDGKTWVNNPKFIGKIGTRLREATRSSPRATFSLRTL